MGRRPIALLAGDLFFVILASLTSNFLRFEAFLPSEFPHYANWLVLNLVVTPLTFYLFGMYRGIWRYASISDLVTVSKAVGARTVVLITVFLLLGYERGMPRSVILIDAMLMLGLTGGIRLMARMQREMTQIKSLKKKKPVLIVGAGDAGEIILREMKNNQQLDYNPIGFIDDDASKWGVRIHGVAVLGGRDEIPRIAAEREVREAIVAIPSATGQDLAEVYQYCQRAGIRAKTLPPMRNLIDGDVHLSQVRDVELEDLLGRKPVHVDLAAIRSCLSGKRVIITGGGGSIGRELARQVAEFEPEELFILDRNENSVYFVEIELRRRFTSLALEVGIADIMDKPRVQEIFARFRPDIIIHAAAYKHVPLMELNAAEAFKNNVLGTRILVEAAGIHGCERFVLISTDKAVNPASIMGATKRLAELAVQGANGMKTKFVAVRFGNVLGSDGSVVPLFKKQVAQGGPVTVTHPEVTRFFMTIPEAVQLVLQAGAMGDGGEVYMLDMGRPIKIVDMARNLIELSGFRPDVDIEIAFTGLRPGEKLHEELHLQSEDVQATNHQKILRCRDTGEWPSRVIERLESIEERCRQDTAYLKDQEVRRILAELVPEFLPPPPDQSGGEPETTPSARKRTASH